MNKKSVFTIISCLLCSFVLFSCGNLFNNNEKQTSLTVNLPYGTERAAAAKSYKFKITFTHESGTENVLEGESGNAVSLAPAEPGEYVVYGEAYNEKNEVIFKGETKATVVDGEETVVTLTMKRQMYEVESQSEHMKLFPDKQGIRIVLNAVEGDGDWGVKDFRLIEKDTGIRFELHGSPTAEAPVVLYYPFTEKGKSYSFELSHKEGLKEVTETAACSAGGGEGDCFDFTDYLRTKIILDSSAAGKDTMKLSYDVTRAVKAEKIAENKFLDVGIIYSVYSGKSDWKDTAYVGTDILTKYSNEGFELNYDPILTELNLTERFIDNEHVDFEELKERYNWFATAALRFRMADLPDQDFIAPYIVSENYVYRKTRKAESEHLKFEYDAKGVKVTFNYLPGDGNWNTDYYLESADGKYSLNFVENTPPTAVNPAVTYYLALTEQDKYYEYNFVMQNGGTVATEKLGCVAGGGNAGVVNIPDSWDGYTFEVNAEEYDSGTLRSKNNLLGIFGSVNGATITQYNYSNVFDEVSYYFDVYAGGYNDPDKMTIYNWKHGTIYSTFTGFDYLSGDPMSLENYINYQLFGKRNKWSMDFVYNIGIKDTGTVLSMRKLVYEDDYTGETVENDFVQFTEEIDNGWSVFYAGPESAIPTYNVISTSENGIKVDISDLDESNFYGSDTYRLQFKHKVSPDVLTVYPHAYYTMDCNSEPYPELGISLYDANLKQINYCTHSVGAPAPHVDFYARPGQSYYYAIEIYSNGMHDFSNISFYPGD